MDDDMKKRFEAGFGKLDNPKKETGTITVKAESKESHEAFIKSLEPKVGSILHLVQPDKVMIIEVKELLTLEEYKKKHGGLL